METKRTLETSCDERSYPKDRFIGYPMINMMTTELRVRIDERAARVLKNLKVVEPKIFVTVESRLYITCCGGYEEKYLRVQVLDKIEDSSNLILVDGDQRIYMQREALDLLESSGNHLTIYADLKGELYTDQ